MPCLQVIILNSGVHDLGGANHGMFSVAEYAARLRQLWTTIRAATQRTAGRRGGGAPVQLIWMSTGGVYSNPHSPEGTYLNRTYCPKAGDPTLYSHPIPVLRDMDAAGRLLAEEFGADVLDQARIRELSTYDGDGLHCLKGVVCQGTFDALVQLIALGPKRAAAAGAQ